MTKTKINNIVLIDGIECNSIDVNLLQKFPLTNSKKSKCFNQIISNHIPGSNVVEIIAFFESDEKSEQVYKNNLPYEGIIKKFGSYIGNQIINKKGFKIEFEEINRDSYFLSWYLPL